MRERRPEILYLVHRVPYPPDKGDRIRAFHILRYLARHADIHLASLADEAVPDETVAALEAHCKRVAIVRVRSIGRWLRALESAVESRVIFPAIRLSTV